MNCWAITPRNCRSPVQAGRRWSSIGLGIVLGAMLPCMVSNERPGGPTECLAQRLASHLVSCVPRRRVCAGQDSALNTLFTGGFWLSGLPLFGYLGRWPPTTGVLTFVIGFLPVSAIDLQHLIFVLWRCRIHCSCTRGASHSDCHPQLEMCLQRTPARGVDQAFRLVAALAILVMVPFGSAGLIAAPFLRGREARAQGSSADLVAETLYLRVCHSPRAWRAAVPMASRQHRFSMSR